MISIGGRGRYGKVQYISVPFDWMKKTTNAKLLKEMRTWNEQDIYENVRTLILNCRNGVDGFTISFVNRVLAVLEKAINSTNVSTTTPDILAYTIGTIFNNDNLRN